MKRFALVLIALSFLGASAASADEAGQKQAEAFVNPLAVGRPAHRDVSCRRSGTMGGVSPARLSST